MRNTEIRLPQTKTEFPKCGASTRLPEISSAMRMAPETNTKKCKLNCCPRTDVSTPTEETAAGSTGDPLLTLRLRFANWPPPAPGCFVRYEIRKLQPPSRFGRVGVSAPERVRSPL
jgi:hypothetical protein